MEPSQVQQLRSREDQGVMAIKGYSTFQKLQDIEHHAWSYGFDDSFLMFNGISTHLGLFYAKRLENHINCAFIFTLIVQFFLKCIFLTQSYLMILKNIYFTHRWDSNKYYHSE